MSVSSNVPKIAFTPTGLVIPTEPEILAGVQTDQGEAFGNGLNPQLTSPQGQMAQSETAIIGAGNNDFAFYVNQIDPATSSGRMQDAIGRLYFLNRNPAESTVVQCQCLGLVGTIIPVGALAQDNNGNFYACTLTGEIPISGTITLPFAAVVTGPIACPAGQLTQIVKAIPGWDTINNAVDGVTGRNVETQQDFEFRRQQTIAGNSKGAAASVYGAVLKVPNVLDAYVYENKTNAPINVGSTAYTLTPHSMYVGVVGGIGTEIARAIFDKLGGGCDLNGNTTIAIPDLNYQLPQPTYDITYNIPDPTPVYFEVNLIDNTSLPSDIVAQVQAAIMNAFIGGDNGPPARIGANINASRYYAPVIGVAPSAVIIDSLFVGLAASPTDATVLMGIDQAPTTSAVEIVVNLI